MLAMVALIGLIIIAVLLIGFFCQFLFLSHQKERTDADECALSFAHVLNNRDRIGQMNTAVERSRELVHGSRLALDALKRDESDPALEDFARLLTEEARAGAHLVESSRQMLCQEVTQDAFEATKEYKKKLGARTGSKVGVMNVSPALLNSVEIGVPLGVLSNVTTVQALDELLKHDRQNGYVSQAGLALVGDINAKLPSPDNDLDFMLTPLASPIGTGMSPPRLTANKVFDSKANVSDEKPQAVRTQQIPSAVRVKMEVPVSAQGLSTLSSKMQVAASAAAGGAMPAPDELDVQRQ
ncbi:MAG: hypothetical protein C0507_03840 [Cyanobacteria bacterium PR.3.49]|nr:hypothetical protein [Cyanobacteria bacterium PR.3.49]